MAKKNLENIENPAQKTPSPEQSVDSPAGSSEISKPKPWVKVGAVVTIVILLVGAVGYLVYQNYQLKKQPTPEPTPSQQPTQPPAQPVIRPDPTAEWEIYTNEKYGYSVKYPLKTKVEEGSGYEERVQETIFTFFGPKYQGPGEFTDGFGITIAVIKNSNNKTPTQFAQEYYKQAEENINNKILEGDISKCKVESVVRSNTNGAKFTYCTQAPGTGTLNFSEWYVKDGITFQIYAVLRNEDYLTTFNQILPTFKFLDQTQTDETAGWQEYEGTDYGYSIRYPDGWHIDPNLRTSRGDISISSPDYSEVQLAPAGTLDSGGVLVIRVVENSENLTLDELTDPNSALPALLTNSRKTYLSGIEAIKYDFKGDGSPSVNLTLLKDGKRYLISLQYTEAEKSKYIRIFDQILSTFKFTD